MTTKLPLIGQEKVKDSYSSFKLGQKWPRNDHSNESWLDKRLGDNEIPRLLNTDYARVDTLKIEKKLNTEEKFATKRIPEPKSNMNVTFSEKRSPVRKEITFGNKI